MPKFEAVMTAKEVIALKLPFLAQKEEHLLNRTDPMIMLTLLNAVGPCFTNFFNRIRKIITNCATDTQKALEMQRRCFGAVNSDENRKTVFHYTKLKDRGRLLPELGVSETDLWGRANRRHKLVRL